jgi:predicted Zn-dependent protease
MLNKLNTRLILLSCLSVFICSCSQVAITGRKQLNLVPDSVINQLSFQNYDEFISQNKLSTNTEQVRMVKTVGERIQKAVEKYCQENNLSKRLEGYEWEFNLVEDEAVNAWAMPGGKVVVYTGLLPVAENEAGLATVMGHEIGHVIARHGAEQMSQDLVIELGGMALSEAITKQPEKVQSIFMNSYKIGSEVGVMLPYSRTHELEADHLGLIFMAMAGYNPQEALSFWQRMSSGSQESRLSELLSTHPADSRRIKNIESLMPEALSYYNQ